MAAIKDKGEKLVFGLDIGTRSIVGTVGQMRGERFCVLAQSVEEHASRAMLDGQIHHIGKVGDTIRRIRERLEEELGESLSEVCIAAAGRVLRTVTTTVERDLEQEREITGEDIYALSTQGVEQAYGELEGQRVLDMEETRFYCVGHTPMFYYMDGMRIGDLEGHKARRISMDLIATFLPMDVVDGLYKAVELAGLSVANLTLEPIAAIQVAIPERFRMLNIALVDVGAGTSDISITREGVVCAYGMIPAAGDGLTDRIVQHCLVEFAVAEDIKRQLGEKEKITFQDVIGLEQTVSRQEILELLRPDIERLAGLAGECILQLNGDKPVSAVFVVGGGGMVPGYTQHLAQVLGIAESRVVIRGEEVLGAVDFAVKDPIINSLMVTPIGIALSYYQQTNSFIFVGFNGERVKLYDNGGLTVADAAVASKLPNDALFPKRGEALNLWVDGKSRIIRGEAGEAAAIRLNGREADLTTHIKNGDSIQFTPSTRGEAASLAWSKLPEVSKALRLHINGKEVSLPLPLTINGKEPREDFLLREGDEIWTNRGYTLERLLEVLDIQVVEGSPIEVEGRPAGPDTKVYEGFHVLLRPERQAGGAVLSFGTREREDVAESEAVEPGSEKAEAGVESGTEDAAESGPEFRSAPEAVSVSAESKSKSGSDPESDPESSAPRSESKLGAGPGSGVGTEPESGQADTGSEKSGTGASVESGVESGADFRSESGADFRSESGSEESEAGLRADSGGKSGSESRLGFGADSDDHSYSLSRSAATKLQAGAQASAFGQEMPREELEIGRIPPAAPPKPAEDIMVLVNGKPVVLRGKREYIFVDIFEFIDFDLKAPAGKRVVTKHNGRRAEFMHKLENGDAVELSWED